MDEQTEVTVKMLRSLIESMDAGVVRVLDRSGSAEGDIATLTLVVEGTPLPVQPNTKSTSD